MLIAENQNKNRISAWNASRSDYFTCPECQTEVILKQGKIREAHFAHKPDADCPYQQGETELHLRIKRAIYEDLSQQSNCFRCELERRLSGVRPDISLYIGSYPVVIEIQRSDISIDLIIKRTLRYTELGIYLLWILPELKFNENGVCHVKAWHKFLHRLQYERIYLWTDKACIKPVHLEPYYIWREVYEDWESGNTYGGYSVPSKTMRYGLYPGDHNFHIAKDFEPVQRSQFLSEAQFMPETKLWGDKLDRWWIDE